jgi:hypothetical protein
VNGKLTAQPCYEIVFLLTFVKAFGRIHGNSSRSAMRYYFVAKAPNATLVGKFTAEQIMERLKAKEFTSL